MKRIYENKEHYIIKDENIYGFMSAKHFCKHLHPELTKPWNNEYKFICNTLRKDFKTTDAISIGTLKNKKEVIVASFNYPITDDEFIDVKYDEELKQYYIEVE